MQYLGDFAEDSTVHIPFNTFSSDDPQASVTATNLIASDIYVHKDGSTTDIVTDGATVAIDFDTITGNHLVTIDTSASADYSTGSDYLVRIEGVTVDGGTINAIIGSFSIENRFNDVNVVTVSGTAQTANDNGADINTLLTRIVGTLAAGTHNPASAAQIAVLSDWINGGRLDLILDIIAADTTTDIPALIATAQTDLDTITGADGVTLASTQPNSLSLQPVTITAGDAIANITLAGSGTENGISFTRSGSGDPFDANFIGQINATVDTALTDYDAATGTELAATEAKVDSILVDTASIGITKNATFSNLEFLMVDETDHVTPETGLTVTGTMSIDGAAFAAINGTIAEVGSGIYQVDLTAADTNGDVITYKFSSTGAADRFITIKTRA